MSFVHIIALFNYCSFFLHYFDIKFTERVRSWRWSSWLTERALNWIYFHWSWSFVKLLRNSLQLSSGLWECTYKAHMIPCSKHTLQICGRRWWPQSSSFVRKKSVALNSQQLSLEPWFQCRWSPRCLRSRLASSLFALHGLLQFLSLSSIVTADGPWILVVTSAISFKIPIKTPQQSRDNRQCDDKSTRVVSLLFYVVYMFFEQANLRSFPLSSN